MKTRSEPLVNGQPAEPARRRRASSAVVSRAGVIGAMEFLLRIIAVMLILASTFGNYVQFIGGWARWYPIQWPIVGVALLYQLICSLLQWGFKAASWWFPYSVALLASAVPSFLTYNALFGPYLSAQLGPLLSAIGIAIAVIGGDALPEWVLVE